MWEQGSRGACGSRGAGAGAAAARAAAARAARAATAAAAAAAGEQRVAEQQNDQKGREQISRVPPPSSISHLLILGHLHHEPLASFRERRRVGARKRQQHLLPQQLQVRFRNRRQRD